MSEDDDGKLSPDISASPGSASFALGPSTPAGAQSRLSKSRLTFHISLPLKYDKSVTLTLPLRIFHDPHPLDRSVHFEFFEKIRFGCFLGLVEGEEMEKRVVEYVRIEGKA